MDNSTVAQFYANAILSSRVSIIPVLREARDKPDLWDGINRLQNEGVILREMSELHPDDFVEMVESLIAQGHLKGALQAAEEMPRAARWSVEDDEVLVLDSAPFHVALREVAERCGKSESHVERIMLMEGAVEGQAFFSDNIIAFIESEE